MTCTGNSRFSARGDSSATLPFNAEIRLCRDSAIDCDALGPEDTGSEDTGPEGTRPEDTGPEDTGPEDTGPEDIDETYRVVPCHCVASADWTRVFLTVRENRQDRGFTFVRDEPFTEPRAIIGRNRGANRPFILCTLWSCTPLAGGSYRIRLSADEVIPLKPESVETMRRSLDARIAIAAT